MARWNGGQKIKRLLPKEDSRVLRFFFLATMLDYNNSQYIYIHLLRFLQFI